MNKMKKFTIFSEVSGGVIPIFRTDFIRAITKKEAKENFIREFNEKFGNVFTIEIKRIYEYENEM